MDKNERTKADSHDHNDHLPKDILNLAQDENSFRDPLEQQLEKQHSSLESSKDKEKHNKKEK